MPTDTNYTGELLSLTNYRGDYRLLNWVTCKKSSFLGSWEND